MSQNKENVLVSKDGVYKDERYPLDHNGLLRLKYQQPELERGAYRLLRNTPQFERLIRNQFKRIECFRKNHLLDKEKYTEIYENTFSCITSGRTSYVWYYRRVSLNDPTEEAKDDINHHCIDIMMAEIEVSDMLEKYPNVKVLVITEAFGHYQLLLIYRAQGGQLAVRIIDFMNTYLCTGRTREFIKLFPINNVLMTTSNVSTYNTSIQFAYQRCHQIVLGKEDPVQYSYHELRTV